MVLLAGVLMISGSMNSNVAQRTKFFGMMRCIGASRKQIIRFVRLEALNWCKTAVPVGLILGTLITWCVCALLHYGIGGEFAGTPVFALSPV
ncbi:FtsX-like permease family protein, partial [Streptomyces caniscabiei]|uniref:FtsX-like permease family protein n=1 Tax=Streptomyces caniscabiei TaxID=2746961 RepID=UPI0038F76FEE